MTESLLSESSNIFYISLSLLVHLPADARLAQAQAPVGPLLGVYDAQLAAAPILAALTGSVTIHHLNADGQLDSSPHPEAT